MRSRAARWAPRTALALAMGAAAHGAHTIYDQSGHVARYARSYWGQSLTAAQDRILGADYMNSIRAVRAAIGQTETVYLVDAGSGTSGAPYFAAHYLAPRRIVLVGTVRVDGQRAIRRRLPDSARWVVVVPNEGEPLRLLAAERFRGSGRRGR